MKIFLKQYYANENPVSIEVKGTSNDDIIKLVEEYDKKYGLPVPKYETVFLLDFVDDGTYCSLEELTADMTAIHDGIFYIDGILKIEE